MQARVGQGAIYATALSGRILLETGIGRAHNLAMATLQQHPWKGNRYPSMDDLSGIKRWMQPLLDEEQKGLLSGEPCR